MDKLLELEGEKRSFEERYDILAGEKASLEDKAATLDDSVKRFSLCIEVLVEEKNIFEDRVDRADKQFGEEVENRWSAEDDLGWLLQKVIVSVVDKVVECFEFAVGVKQMKKACMDASVENGMQEVREQVIASMFVLGEAVATTEHIQAMYHIVKEFIKTDFASYLCLGDLVMGGLQQLCDDYDAEDIQVECGSSHAGAS